MTLQEALMDKHETEEAARVRRADQLQSFAPLVQGLQEQAASGLLSAGEARRQLDQMALDMAFADFIDQREMPFHRPPIHIAYARTRARARNVKLQ